MAAVKRPELHHSGVPSRFVKDQVEGRARTLEEDRFPRGMTVGIVPAPVQETPVTGPWPFRPPPGGQVEQFGSVGDPVQIHEDTSPGSLIAKSMSAR